MDESPFDFVSNETAADGFSEIQRNVLFGIAGVSTTLSLLGSLFIVAIYFRFKGKNMKLLVWLSIADIASDIITFVSLATDPEDAAKCSVVAFMVTVADLIPVLWTGAMSLSIMISVFVTYKTGRRGDEFLPAYAAFCTVVPLAFAVAAAVKHQYGDSGYGLCWIRDSAVRIYYFYIPLWVTIVFNSIVYYLIHREYMMVMRSQHGALGSSTSSSRVHRLRYYPMILALAWFFGTVNRVLQLFNVSLFFLAVLHIAFGKAHGFLNAIVYGSDPMQEAYPLLIQKCRGEPSIQPPQLSPRDPDTPSERYDYDAGRDAEMQEKTPGGSGSAEERDGQRATPSAFMDVPID